MCPHLRGVENLAFVVIGDAASRSTGFTTFVVIVLAGGAWFIAHTFLREVVVNHFPAWRNMKGHRDLAWAIGLGAFGLFMYFVGVHALSTVALSDGQVLDIVLVPLCFMAASWAWKRSTAHGHRLIHTLGAIALIAGGVLFVAQAF